MKKLVVTDKGIGIAEMPEKPYPYQGDDQYFGSRMDEYEAAVKQAIASAPLFEDQERVWAVLLGIDKAVAKSFLEPRDYLQEAKRHMIGNTYPIPLGFPEYVEVMVPKRVWFVEHKETREWLCSSLDGLFTNDPLKAYFYDSEAEAGLVIEVRKLYFSMPTEHEFDITVLRFVDKQEQTPSKESSMNDAEVLREYAKHQTVLVIKENLNRIADRLDSLQSKLKDRDELLEEMVGYIRTTKTDTKTALTGMKILTRYSNLKAK